MTFWSGETLKKELPRILSEYSEGRVDGISYKLRMGDEVFITSTLGQKERTSIVKKLEQAESFRIPPGQYAFLLTEERIDMPSNAFGQISLRTSAKFKGLVNVSGFHVNPDFYGKLLFAVYNAGPQYIKVCRGEKLFLLFISNIENREIEQQRNLLIKDREKGYESIPMDILNSNSGLVHSPAALGEKLKFLEAEFKQWEAHGKTAAKILTIVLTILTAAVAIFIYLASDLKEDVHNSVTKELIMHYQSLEKQPEVIEKKIQITIK